MNRVSRLFAIHDALRQGSRPLDAQQWSLVFRVNQRTILRDMAFLKKELKVPLYFDNQLKGYRYKDTQLASAPKAKKAEWNRLLALVQKDIRMLKEAGFPVQKLLSIEGQRTLDQLLGPKDNNKG